MRKLAHPRLPKRRTMNPGDIDRVARPLRIEFHQLRARQCRRKRAISRMVPAARANTRRIAETALHFIRDCRRQNDLLARCADALGRREHSGKIVARMGRFFRQIGVVVIEITNAAAIRERGPIRRRLVRRADDCRAVFRRKFRNHRPRNRARLFVPRAERAS